MRRSCLLGSLAPWCLRLNMGFETGEEGDQAQRRKIADALCPSGFQYSAGASKRMPGSVVSLPALRMLDPSVSGVWLSGGRRPHLSSSHSSAGTASFLIPRESHKSRGFESTGAVSMSSQSFRCNIESGRGRDAGGGTASRVPRLVCGNIYRWTHTSVLTSHDLQPPPHSQKPGRLHCACLTSQRQLWTMPDNIVLRPFDVDEEPEPSSEAYYTILSDAIQPDTKTTTETTVDQIVKYIPKDGTSETLNFLDLCFDVGEQIHYNHPSQSKLVTIMDLVLKDPKVVSPRGDAVSSLQDNSADRKMHIEC